MSDIRYYSSMSLDTFIRVNSHVLHPTVLKMFETSKAENEELSAEYLAVCDENYVLKRKLGIQDD